MNVITPRLPEYKRSKTKGYVSSVALLRMAVKNLGYKKLRNGLTIVGIMIGTGSVFMLLSFGLGLQSLVEQQITDGRSMNTIDVTATGSRVLKIDDTAIKDISEIKHVRSTGGVFVRASKLTIKGAAADVVAYGVDDLYLQTANLAIRAGKQLDPKAANEVVLSNSILEAIGIKNPKDAIGETVVIKFKNPSGKYVEKELQVAGVIASGNGTEAFVSDQIFKEAGVRTYSQVKVLADDTDNVIGVRKIIESMGYDTASPLDTLKQVGQFFRVFRIILVSFGCIGMIIAILGMINTLTISLLERTREVALMLALGARPRDMQNLFIIEALLLSLLGGAVGIICALGLSRFVDAVLNELAKSRGTTAHFSVFASPPWLVLLALLIMALIALLVAYIPAKRAGHIDSIEVLRSE